MEFKAAAAFKVPFGLHKGRTLDAVAETDDGLRFLDWLRGQNWLRTEMATALATYLEDPAIAEDLAKVVKRGARR